MHICKIKFIISEIKYTIAQKVQFLFLLIFIGWLVALLIVIVTNRRMRQVFELNQGFINYTFYRIVANKNAKENRRLF